MKEELLEFCLYYKGENKNPFNPEASYMEEMRYHFWNEERIVCEYYDTALNDFNMYNKSHNIDPGEFTPEDVFKFWMKACLMKYRDDRYDFISTYFENKLISR